MTTAEKLLQVNAYVDHADNLNKKLGKTLYSGSNVNAPLDTNVNQATADFDAIKNKMVEKGAVVSANTPTSDYANKIDEIVAVSEESARNAFWECYQQNGTRTNYMYAIYGNSWVDDIYHPIYPFKFVGNCNYVFCNSRITDIVLPIDATEATSTTALFAYNTRLKTIPCIKITEETTFSLWFDYCDGLESVTFEGVIGQNGLTFSRSAYLSHDSLMNIINALQDKSEDTSGTVWKVTLGATNLAKLSAEEKDIATMKGWTLT